VTAMVPSSVLLLFASTLIAKNIYKAGFAPQTNEATVLRLSRILVLIIMVLALILAFYFPRALVNLLLIGYDGVSQFFPGVVFGLFWKKVTRRGVVSGLLVGFTLAAILVFSGHDPFLGLNAGFVALVFNTLLTAILSLTEKKDR